MTDIPPVPEELIDFLQGNFPQEIFSPIHSLHEMVQVNRNRAKFVATQIWIQAFYTGVAWQSGRENVKYMVVTQETLDKINQDIRDSEQKE